MIMLTEDDKEFMQFWEEESLKYKKWTFMLIRNLPRGLIYTLPIVLFFLYMGFKRRAIISHGDLITIMISIFIIAVFYAILKGHIKVDRYESHYEILKMKQERDQ